VEADRLRFVALDRTRNAELIREASRFRAGEGAPEAISQKPVLGFAAAALLAIVCAGLVGWVSDLGYSPPRVAGSELIVSFKHPGAVSEDCRELSEAELAATPVHMRKAVVCERKRTSVRLLVTVDGETVVRKSVAPGGIWSDGNSVIVEHIPTDLGEHHVTVAIGETPAEDEWNFREERTLRFDDESRRVVLFDRLTGFSWH
jgi:hypothetical protein